MKTNEYVEEREKGLYIAGTRVSLDSVVYAFRDGASAESIAFERFPSLSLEQVYGACAFYLGHRAEVDAYLKEGEAAGEAWREEQRASDPVYTKRMAALRGAMMAGR